ncbi:MAG: rhomboid family intramembrane serine protease [Lysobacterales bacterium]
MSDIVTNWSRKPPTTPWVMLAISFLCLFFALMYSFATPLAQQALIDVLGAVPARTSAMLSLPLTDWVGNGMLSLVASLFLHASWLHLAGNLAYLWVFGLPVERQMGGFLLALLFLLGGVLSHLILAARLPDLDIPIVGASGAVSAVVGTYLGLFPYRSIGLYVPLGLYLQFARVPAVIVIGSWFTLQLVYTVFGPISGFVAWWTHLAGFTLGLMFAFLVRAVSYLRN